MIKHKKLLCLLTSVILMTSLFTGCGASSSDSKTTASKTPKVVKFNLAMPTSMDPHLWTFGTHVSRMGVFEGLTKADENMKISPANAEKWEHSSDYKTWTFHLRKDLKWSDGSKLTAHDYEYSFKHAVDPKAHAGKTGAFITGVPIENADKIMIGEADASTLGVKALDDNTLEVKLSIPRNNLDLSVSEGWGIPVNEKNIKEKGADWATPENILTNGPYKIKTWEKNAKMILVPNTNYYGKVNLDEIDIIQVTSNEVIAYQNGDFNIANVTQTDMDSIQKDEKLKNQLHTFKTGLIYYCGMLGSTNDILQKNAKVRQAIQMSIDKDKIAKDIMKGTERPGRSLVPEIFAKWGEEIGLKYDPEQAKKLMAEAGYPDGKGFPQMTILLSVAPTGRELAIKDMIEKGTGIKVQLKNEEWAAFSKDISKVYNDGTIGWFLFPWGTPGNLSFTGYFANFQFDVAKAELDAKGMQELFNIQNDAKIDPGKKTKMVRDYIYKNTTDEGRKYVDLVNNAMNAANPEDTEKLLKEAGMLREQSGTWFAVTWQNGMKLIKPEIKGYQGSVYIGGSPMIYFNDLKID